MHNANIVIGHSYGYAIPTLALVALIYFTVNFLLSMLSRRLENKTA
jgi:putative glutamine transport system permease protein